MICPHCKKPIKTTISAEIKKKAIALSAQGYSPGDVQVMLGGAISFSSVCRILKDRKNK